MNKNTFKIISFILIVSLMCGCSKSSPFEKVNLEQAINLLSSEETVILYIGSPECRYCQMVLEPLAEAGVKSQNEIYYLDTSNYRNLPAYKTLEVKLNELLEEGFNYIPLVLVVNESGVLGHHVGVVETYDSSTEHLTSDQRKELEEIYINLFKIKEGNK